MATRNDKPTATVVLGPQPGQSVSVYGFPAVIYGTPLIQLTGDVDGLVELTPDQAEQLGRGLLEAAAAARPVRQ